ncbi:MAG: hypothetical protein OHK0057_26930 [Thermoflexibacter sp.]
MIPTFQTDIIKARNFLYQLLVRQVDEKAKSWIEQKIHLLANSFSTQNFYIAFTSAPRFVGKQNLHLSFMEEAEANAIRKGFTLKNWTIDRTTRILFVLYLPTENAENHVSILSKVFQTAEVNELVALYAALPLLPFPEKYIYQCTEGIRTNMAPVFEAVALNNPFPAEFLDENAWNQLFLKAIFTGKKIYQIQGVKQRANATLAQICSDFAHERWAAGRKVTPELWMPVGHFTNDAILKDLEKLKESDDILQRQALVLVCLESNHAQAKELLTGLEDLKEKALKGEFSWESISEQWHEVNQ